MKTKQKFVAELIRTFTLGIGHIGGAHLNPVVSTGAFCAS
jgi:glycerol uptake facilitator-like aquaporin